MRFNKQELQTLATQPSQKFDKEGVLFLRERQEGFFRRTERQKDTSKESKKGKRSKGLRELSCYSGASKVSLERWCRLRGNLLFYFKSRDQWSEPLGVVILEQCTIKIDTPSTEGPFGFSLVFDGGLSQHVAAHSEQERDAWLEAIQLGSYESMRSQLLALQQRMELRRGQDPDLDIQMWRLRRGQHLDPCELPLCEISLACDNLLCDGNGRPPNPVLLVHVFLPQEGVLLKYAKTEVFERSSNPNFLNTVSFRASDGLTADSRIRLTAYDVCEPVSQTATPIGSATITLSVLQDSERIRIPLKSSTGSTVGFLSVTVWSLEREDANNPSTESTPCRRLQPQPQFDNKELSSKVFCHRRSQSLPPRLGTKLKLPHQGQLRLLFANSCVQTYRFHSGLGGDISVHEIMAESCLCFHFPQQLLGLWIQEEKELLQEVAGMGELVEPWHTRQVELLDRHLHLLHLYSQAKENLNAHRGTLFKPSSRKNDRLLEFAPVNLHLQRMWVQNETLKKCDFYDIITVGAFTAHSHKSKNGGLIKLLQQLKESPIKGSGSPPGISKITMANDTIQAIKQLRREVVDAMRALMKLAKEKQTAGMLPICEDMISKTRILLSLWDPGLVEEALSFVEEHKVASSSVGSTEGMAGEGGGADEGLALSPFRRIAQQLSFNELKSPDLDELVTPDSPRCLKGFWDVPRKHHQERTVAVAVVQDDDEAERQFSAFPDAEEDERNYGKKSIDENSNLSDEKVTSSEDGNREEEETGSDAFAANTPVSNGFDCEIGRKFLDTHAMCSSPSANYYKPTDEPEPWDLTQLNIEASVMCLVSKVKFLCGRCGSPAVRLRAQRSIARSRSFRSDLSSNVVTSQPTNNVTPSSNVVSAIVMQPRATASRTNSDDALNKAVDCATVVRNKFTEGLDFATLTDWTLELKPSMRKLRQAMDGLLKTARLTHSVFRVQEDRRAAQRACNVRYRRHVCFSQALTSLVTSLMAKLWCQKPDPTFLLILSSIGPLVSFEGLLSYYGDEIDMWGDMAIAVEDLRTVTFTCVRCPPDTRNSSQIVPKVMGSRSAVTVLLPVPDAVHSLLPLSTPAALSFHVTPLLFNVGINEMATLAESLGATRPQERSNVDNFDRLNQYYHRFKKLNIPAEKRGPIRTPHLPSLSDLMLNLKATVNTSTSKNIAILKLSSRICRRMKGLRFTSCKSAKDRTGMSVTLEQCSILRSEYDLAEHEFQRALDCMRSEGCRRENTYKNTGVRKYAFNSLQLLTLPKLYRPPAGTYGSAQT